MAIAALGILASAALGFAKEDALGGSVVVGHFLASAALLLVGAHVLPQAASRATAAVVGRLIAVQLPLMLISFVNLGIAGGAIFNAELDALWLALLAGPALVGLALGISGGRQDDGTVESDGVNMTTKTRLLPLRAVPSDAGKPDAMATLATRTVHGLYVAVFTALLGLILSITYAYWRFLKDGLFEGGGTNFTDWLNTIPSLLSVMMPVLIALPLVLFLVEVVAGAAGALDDWRVNSQNINAQREFSSGETAYVSASVAAIDRYLTDKKYPNAYGFAYGLGFLAAIGLMFLAGYGLFQLLPSLWEFLRSARTEGVEALHYSGGAPAFALVGAVFASIFLVWAVFQASIFVAPEFAEYMYAREGWNSMTPHERDAKEFTPFVIRQLRAGVLTPARDPDPPALIRAAFRQHEATVFGGTGILWIAVAVVFYLDVSSYRLFTDEKIVYTDYWSSGRIEIPYHAVDHVETSCWLNNKNEPIVGYRVYFDESRSEDLLDFEDLRKEDLPVERIDRKLRDARVSVRHAASRTALNHSNAFEAACLDSLRGELGESGYARAERLLRAS